MKLNGITITIKTNIKLDDLLKENKFNTEHIVVELNSKIVPKNSYSKTEIKNEDIIEVLSFVGGG